MRYATISALALLLGAGNALASDLTPLPGRISGNGTGCYVGAFIAGAFVRQDTGIPTIMDLTTGQVDVGGGPELGCDLALGQVVVGVWTDYTLQAGKSVNTLLGVNMTSPIGNEWAVGGKLGVYTSEAHTTMIYGKGGYVLAEGETVHIGPFSGLLSGPHGFVGALGIETSLVKPVTLFLEYRHEAFDTSSVNMGGLLPTKFTESEDKIMGGLHFHF